MSAESIAVIVFGSLISLLVWTAIRELRNLEATAKGFIDHSITMARYDERLKQLELRRDYIDDWKHLTVDPYIPRAMDDHERRITNLENRR